LIDEVPGLQFNTRSREREKERNPFQAPLSGHGGFAFPDRLFAAYCMIQLILAKINTNTVRLPRTRVDHENMVQSRDQRSESHGTALIKCVP